MVQPVELLDERAKRRIALGRRVELGEVVGGAHEVRRARRDRGGFGLDDQLGGAAQGERHRSTFDRHRPGQ